MQRFSLSHAQVIGYDALQSKGGRCMSSGLFALLDDIALIAKTAATSMDDVVAAATKASTKSLGVVVDDAAVTPKYVVGFPAARELPIVKRIAVGSLKNKLLFILPAALILSQFASWAITPLLVLGGLFLCFEGAEKVIEMLGHGAHSGGAAKPKSEDQTVSGAVQTDFILSAEIMTLALSTVDGQTIGTQAAALLVVAFFVTFVVYGAVALIVKADDFGLHLLTTHKDGPLAALGRGILTSMPVFLSTLSFVGTLAMLWVGGGILIHAAEHYGWHLPEQGMHIVQSFVHGDYPLNGLVEWFAGAVFSGIFGILFGSAIVFAMSPFHGSKQ